MPSSCRPSAARGHANMCVLGLTRTNCTRVGDTERGLDSCMQNVMIKSGRWVNPAPLTLSCLRVVNIQSPPFDLQKYTIHYRQPESPYSPVEPSHSFLLSHCDCASINQRLPRTPPCQPLITTALLSPSTSSTLLASTRE